MDVLNEYLNLLWTQLQYDWSIFTNPWMLYLVIPDLCYLLFFFVKWYVLLIPITLPCTILSNTGRTQYNVSPTVEEKKDPIGDKLAQLLKG